MTKSRIASVSRETGETRISLELNLDGSGKYEIKTGVGFFDHMLAQVARHGLLDLKLSAVGDLEVDPHHTVEDTGIVLGRALKEALGGKEGITRYGQAIVPMDESLALAAIDLSGRPYLGYKANLGRHRLGEFDLELIPEFFQAMAVNAGMNIHLHLLSEGNLHHSAEAIFKAFGRALAQAVRYDERITGTMSTKGTL